MATWQVLARSPTRQILGVLQGWSLDLTIRHNEVGAWSFTQPRERCPAGWPVPGCGLIFIRSGVVIASGTLDEDQFGWSADTSTDEGGAGRYSLGGDTDLGLIAYRLVYPTHGQPWGPLQGAYYLHSGGTAGFALRTLVNRQAGPSAQLARRVTGLTVAVEPSGTPTYNVRERFTPLLDACRKIADAGNLAFDVVDKLNGTVEFQSRITRDLSTSIRFGVELGNVDKITVQRKAPTANTVLLAGGGELDARSLHSYGGGDAIYGRRELFLDQRQVGTDAGTGAPDPAQQAEYDKAGAEALAANKAQTAVNAEIHDTPVTRWPNDYGVGDKVSVLTPWGPVTDIVREVRITVDAKGVETVASTIGTTELSSVDPLATTVRKLSERLNQLERGF